MRILTEKKILIISSEHWDHHFLSKHHLSIALARLGNTVYFLNPPGNKNECISLAKYPRLFLITYKPLIIGLHLLPRSLATWFSKRDANRVKKIAEVDFDIVWTFDPFRFQDIRIFNAHWTLYHVADIHRAKHEDRLADSVQLILGPSSELLRRFDAVKSVCIGHMVNEDFVNRVPNTTVRTSARIQIGYVGNLLSRFLDYPLLVKSVLQNPQCEFTFIGDEKDIRGNQFWQQLIKLEYVHFEGTLPYHELAKHFDRFDMFWCCYDTEKFFREASNSHKILEYLATGKPVISTRLAYYLDKEDILYMPIKNNQLPELIKKVASSIREYDNAESQVKRVRFVREQTYERVLDRIDGILAAL